LGGEKRKEQKTLTEKMAVKTKKRRKEKITGRKKEKCKERETMGGKAEEARNN